MPRINNTFSQGKMNKDLDERIIPNGEYRDAMNVQISTSDGSDVGVIQNLLGNQIINGQTNAGLGDNEGRCVGIVNDEKDDAIYWFIASTTKDLIVQYKAGVVQPVLVDVNKNVLNFNREKIITGINILDNFLFFTDNINEPKKINIQRCIDGSIDFDTQTKLADIPGVIGLSGAPEITESDITVIKKSPQYPPVLEMSDGRREGNVSASINFDFTDKKIDDWVVLVIDNENLNYRASDVLILQSYEDTILTTPLTDFEVKLQISGTPELNGTEQTFRCKIISISSRTPIGIDTSTGLAPSFIVDLLDDTQKIFEFKFPRFSYRWKYQDKEYSTFAPFSEVAFLPGNFDYEPRKGYNLGMTNKLSQLFIKEFITSDIPDDVVSVEILYKESNSANVYVVDSLKKTDEFINEEPYNNISNAWTYSNTDEVFSFYDLNRLGRYEVKSETIYATLPASQLLRPYDSVPRKALAQEITGNRLVYGNYIQNYNLGDVKADFSVALKNFGDVQSARAPKKSLKSMRDYQIGVVYIDEFGRQTPILSSNSGIKKLSKTDAANYNQLNVRLKNNPPGFAKRFKFYIKETANEYYNLAMDRFYDADDGNIWVAFPSSDRNKLDEDTFLILKKGSDSDELVRESAKYKVLAIESQAPDYIKRKFLPLGTFFHNNTAGSDVFGSSSVKHPAQSRDKFSVNYDPFINTNLDNIYKLLDNLSTTEEIFVSFGTSTSNRVSRKYRITNISPTLDADGLPASGTQIDFTIEDKFETDINFIVDSANNQIFNNTSIIFEKVRVENSPRFDGRFFVKIYRDDLIDKYLSPTTTEETEYRVATSKKIYYRSSDFLNIHSNGETTLNGDNYHNNGIKYTDFSSTFFPSQNFPGPSYRDDAWDYWYKWCAWARQKPEHTTDDRVEQDVDVTIGTYQDVWYINDYNWDQQSSGINDTGGTFSSPDHTNFSSNFYPDQNRSRVAVGYQPYTFVSRIEIAITGLEPDPDNLQQNQEQYNERIYSDNDGWNYGDPSIFDVGDKSKNELFAGEASFVDSLAVGKKIRWADDPDGTIYNIIAVSNGYELEYNGQSNNSTLNAYSRPENFTRFWRLFLDGPINWNPITDGGMNGFSPNTDPFAQFEQDGSRQTSLDEANGDVVYEGVSKAIGYTLEVIEPIFDDEELSKNPGIFETEPKENIDLDIYYEASQEFPIDLNQDNFSNVIKTGSIVSLPGYDQVTNGNTSAFNADNPRVINMNANNKIIIYSDTWTSVDLYDNDLLQFTYNEKTITLVIQGDYTINDVDGNNELSISVRLRLHNSPIELDWFNCYSFANGVESNRIKDAFNDVIIDKGAIVSTTLDDNNLYNEDRKTNGLIFSGIYNSIGGINELNQFIQAEKITKDLNPTYGSIQKLFSRQTDLITFCEDRVVKVLANKDAVFNADGNAQLTANLNVLGQTIPFVGDYGISQNPESFASESYRAYFADKQRGAILRLSMDGLTPISDAGMKDWFMDNLKGTNFLIGSYDGRKDEYNLTLKYSGLKDYANLNNKTLSYDEKVKGWTSFKSFIMENACSVQNEYFTVHKGNLYKHHVEGTVYNKFYGQNPTGSSVEFVFNQDPSLIKSFNSIMYEGSQGKVATGTGYTDNNFYSYKNLFDKKGWYVDTISTEKTNGQALSFIEKEDKWFSSIRAKNEGVNNIDLKNFSVQGLGTLENMNVTVSTYSLITDTIELVNTANDPVSSTITIEFKPFTNGVGNITYTVQYYNAISLTPTTLTGANQPNTVYTLVASPTDTDYTFVVTGVDDNGITASVSNTISVSALFPLAITSPTLSINTNTSSSVIIDMSFADATGGVMPYNYSATYSWGPYNLITADITDGTGSTSLLPNTTYNVDIVDINGNPPAQQEDITFEVQVTDSNSSQASANDIIQAGVTPPIFGCTDPTAANYDPSATVDNGSCNYPITPPAPPVIHAFSPNYNNPGNVPGFTNTLGFQFKMDLISAYGTDPTNEPFTYEMEYDELLTNTQPTLPLNPTTINWQPIPTGSYIINDPLVDPNVLTNSFIQPLAEGLTSAHQVDDYQMASGFGIIVMGPYVSDYKVLSFRAKLTDNNGVVQYSNIETIAFYNVDGSPVAGTNTSGI